MRQKHDRIRKRTTLKGQSKTVTIHTESQKQHLAARCDVVLGSNCSNSAMDAQSHGYDSNTKTILLQATCLRTRIPISPDTRLAQRFISSLGRLQMHAGWCLLIPSYIGHTPQIDLAARAAISAVESQKSGEPALAGAAFHFYGQALAMLRKTIDTSDSSLITVTLLDFYEAVTKMHTSSQFSHRYGIAKIMLTRGKSPAGPSELERAMLFSDWDRRFRAPVALGVTSPFEDTYWLDAEPRRKHSPEPIVKLRMLTNKLYIRLPRLILYVRQLRSRSDDVAQVTEKASKLAGELLELRNLDAESFLLHGVKVRKTEDQWDIPIVPYSFRFETLQQMAFATAYWHARLLLLQLCLTMVASGTRFLVAQSEEDLKVETKRLLTNVFMSYQDAKTMNMMGHICIAQPLVVCFGAISHLEYWQDLPVSSVRTWIVLRLKESWGQWACSFGSRELVQINSVFSGGPLGGILTRIYENEKQWFNLQECSRSDANSVIF